MAEPASTPTKKPPKGGRKGGTIYPHINLQRALEYSKKLVSKTHTGAQPEDEILPGVFGTSGPEGKVRASALKQFGLMEGDAKGYKASQLAIDIDAALPDDRPALLQRSMLKSKVFDKVFDTFHGDVVSKAQIAKRAKELKVHPDSADECAQLFIDSAVTSGLGAPDGESLTLVAAGAVTQPPLEGETTNGTGDSANDEDGTNHMQNPADSAQSAEGKEHDNGESAKDRNSKAAVTVTLSVDSSSDPDKLAKQLKLLRDYNVI